MGLQIDYFNHIVEITSPTTDEDMQTVADFIEDQMATPRGLTEDDIIKPEGKIEDPSNPGIFSQIIVLLNSPWQLQFWQGSGYTRLYGGKLVGGLNDQPIKATGAAGDITVLESPVDGVTVASGSGLSAEQDEVLNKLRYMKQYVFIDEEAGPGGDGSAGDPFNVTADGVDFAEANDIFDIMALSDITLERTLKNFTISSIGLKTIDFDGQNCDKSHFNNVKLTGLQVGKVTCKNVTFLDGLSGLNGDYDNVKMGGDVALLAEGTVNIVGIAAIFTNGITPHSFNMSAGTATKLNIREATGAYQIINMNHADKLATLAYSGGGGLALLDNTNTDGTIGLAGILDTAITDNTGAGCSVIKLGVFPGSETIGAAVWSNLLVNNTLSGSFGEAIGLLWDEAGGDRVIDGTTFQEIFYKAGGIEVMRFNLFDAEDNPSIENVHKRVRV